MLERTFTVQNHMGLHARPAAQFVQTTHKFSSHVRVIKDGQEVDGKSIMGILTLAAEFGSQLTIIAEGADEQQLIDKLAELFEKKFDEE